MRLRTAAPSALVAATVLVAAVAWSSPGAPSPPGGGDLDLLASAQPTAVSVFAGDAAFDVSSVHDQDVKVDAMATTSATCDGCSGESSAVQVVYSSGAAVARLDNAAVVWAQSCRRCTGTALSVQVVVLRGRPQAMPNNRAMALTAGCTGCRTAAAAFQVVVLADDARRLSHDAVAELRSWAAEQAELLRATVALPAPEPAPAPDPVAPTDAPTSAPTGPVDGTTGPSEPIDPAARSYRGRRALRMSREALGELEGLVAASLGGSTLRADVHLRR